MRLEIRSACHFLADLLRLGHSLSDQQLGIFQGTLEELLAEHYRHHWFPDLPAKGSGYRCIRINHKMDPLIAKAAQACGVSDSSLLRNMFPNELTLWIDPREVSYRIGENGSICVLYDGSGNNASVPCSNNSSSLMYSTCKESVRGLDNRSLDNRNLHLEQFTPYVSS